MLTKLIKRKDVSSLINACDAGREGELIFNYIAQHSKTSKPIQRLWLQSMTQGAIRDGFSHLRNGQEMQGLGDAAVCRSESVHSPRADREARPRARGTSATARPPGSCASTTGSSWTSSWPREPTCLSTFGKRLDVQWAGHPNWFFRWSKHALPGLRHPLVPEARLLSELDPVPEDLENWVLKPLFSFSGSGVQVDVTRADVRRVPASERARTMLMRKVEYAPAIESPTGERSRVEVRIMFLWRDGRPRPMTTLTRLSQGPMMGVKYNQDKTWVGSTGCLWPKA